MVSVDCSVFIQIVNFLLLIYLLNLILYKPIREIIVKRSNKFKSLKSDIKIMTNDLLNNEIKVKDELEAAISIGKDKQKHLVLEAKKEESRILSEINDKAQSKLNEFRAKIKKDIETSKVKLNQDLNIFAEAISQKILGRAIS